MFIITLSVIFFNLYTTAYGTDNESASVIFGGDVSFSGIVKRNVELGKCTYNTSFEKIRPYLKEADNVVVNLENPVVEKEKADLPKLSGKAVGLISVEESLGSLFYIGFIQWICVHLHTQRSFRMIGFLLFTPADCSVIRLHKNILPLQNSIINKNSDNCRLYGKRSI